MSKTGIAIAVLFLGLALFQGTRGLFTTETAPAPIVVSTPTPTPEPVPTETVSPSPFPRFRGKPPKVTSYESTEELAESLKERGIDCKTLDFLDQPDPTLAEFSLCDPGTEDRRFNIYFYLSRENRAVWLDSMEQQELPLPLVWGPNWIVVAAGDPETARSRIRSIQGAIGGIIEDFSPRKKKG